LALLPDDLGTQFVNSQYDLQRAHYLRHYPGAAWSVIEHLAQAIGRLIVDRTTDPWLLVDIAIVPERRCRGIGTRLIEQLISEAIAAGSGVALSVRVENERALRLYERFGFVTESSDGAYIAMTIPSAERRIE
jgi:ribosomal protein S18 acetylase RimI-like enzyme